MSSNVKPAIVLAHRAWHVPEHYESFMQALRQAGFDVFCPRLPTCNGNKRADADMYTDAHEVRSQIIALVDESREVVMLLHSYGGVVGTEAVKDLSLKERIAKCLRGGVIHLIYVCGYMLQVGESVASASLPRPTPEPIEVDVAAGTSFLCESPIRSLYPDVEPDLAKRMKALLVRQSAKTVTDVITYPAWKNIPTTYLKTLDDQIIFPDWQDRQIKAVRDSDSIVHVESFKSGHSPSLSVPGELVDAAKRAAERHLTSVISDQVTAYS